MTDYESQSSPDAVVAKEVGQWPYYRNRANLSLDWSYGDFGATWIMRYYSGVRDVCWDATAGIECNQPDYTSPSWGGLTVRGVLSTGEADDVTAPSNSGDFYGISGVWQGGPLTVQGFYQQFEYDNGLDDTDSVARIVADGFEARLLGKCWRSSERRRGKNDHGGGISVGSAQHFFVPLLVALFGPFEGLVAAEPRKVH